MENHSDCMVKNYLFELLCDFADYCDQNGLRYYLCGGTLLGAIRHKDFIPWDDDIDVLMPRPDYERFRECFSKNPIRDNYELLCAENGNSPFPFSKIINKQIMVETAFNNLDRNIWIDVFPLDGVPEEKIDSDKMLEYAKKTKRKFAYASANLGSGTKLWKKIIKIPVLVFYKFIGKEYYSKKLLRLSQKYSFDQSTYVAGVAWSCGAKERVNKERFLQYAEVEFHGRLFHAPGCWDEYLKNMYGEYMKLPKESERCAHYIKIVQPNQQEICSS